MLSLKKKIKIVLEENKFGNRKINKVLKHANKVPLHLFIKYKGKKYILDIVGENPSYNTSVCLMRPKKFREYYEDFDIPDSDWI